NTATNKRNIGTESNQVLIHVCDDANSALKCQLCRVFGSTGKDGGKNFPARLIVRDLVLTTDSRERLSDIDTGLQYTEWKFENAIDRVTSAANPRQIERVPKGAEFELELIYTVEDPSHVQDDLNNLKLAIELLKLDAIGGHGSRGYGKVDIKDITIKGMNVKYLKGEGDGKAETDSLDKLSNIIAIFTNGKIQE
ncbi:MAG: type III-A CRISPR-associated RAMP protein Csm3, partial [Thermodesulfovibrionales bacterium]